MARAGREAVAVAILAKAPLPGFAKTRLAAALGADGAAALQARFIARATETACAAAIGAVTLWAAPDEDHPAFQTLAALFGVGLARQDRKSTRLNSSHGYISYAVFCLKKKNPRVCRQHCTAGDCSKQARSR